MSRTHAITERDFTTRDLHTEDILQRIRDEIERENLPQPTRQRLEEQLNAVSEAAAVVRSILHVRGLLKWLFRLPVIPFFHN